MKKIIPITLLSFLMLMPLISNAAISLPWSTTYNCAEWTQGGALSCDDLKPYGGWTCNGLGEQITSAANNPNGGGGKGQRHWKGDGQDLNSGGLNLYFNTPQPELWIRWYMRYEKGFNWTDLEYDKWLYIHTGKSGCDCIPEFVWGLRSMRLAAQGGGGAWPRCTDFGWQDIMGGTTSDGLFHYYEIHIKMDTDGTNGVGQLWVDGAQRINVANVNWSGGNSTARQGWTSFLIGSNTWDPGNGKCMYVDFDDMAINTTGYIGPVKGGPPDTTPPAAPTGVTVI